MRQKAENLVRRLLYPVRELLRWLTPGLGVKRWLALLLVGITLLGLGLAVLVLDIYRNSPEAWWLPALSTLSLRFLTRPLRALIFGGLGAGMVLLGIWGLNRTLLRPFLRPGRPVLDTVTAYRRRERGPRIVAIGGGHGLASLLRGLKEYTNNLTAIVTVADDGGSSGELRRTMGILPPGDIRNCLSALSDDEALISQLFQYRFAEGAGLNGHSLGNLLITALADITGSFEDAVAESGRVLAIHGQVLPSTLHDVKLTADVRLDGVVQEVRVTGESQIPQVSGQIQRVWLEPNNPSAYPPTIQSILAADVIIVGPGSLYTSLLPNLLVPDLAEALRASRALKLFICNVATQPGETDGYSAGDHVHTIGQHLSGSLFDLVLANNYCEGRLPPGSTWVTADDPGSQSYPLYQANLVDPDNPWRHNPQKLARVIIDLFDEKTGPLSGA
ncbi:MAG: YvcK family protein, partial [Anaerolineaceae bacterium]|nr:YvcK family protein [Anaerolineaceae bacterium]